MPVSNGLSGHTVRGTQNKNTPASWPPRGKALVSHVVDGIDDLRERIEVTRL